MSTLPAKPFIPRSLVGMTQGARKRKARDDKELSVLPNPEPVRTEEG